MGEVEPGPGGPLEPPEPPEAATARRPGGIRVLKVRRQRAGGPGPPSPSCPRQRAPPALRPLAACIGPGRRGPTVVSVPRPRPGLGRLGPRCWPSLAAARQAHDSGRRYPPPPPSHPRGRRRLVGPSPGALVPVPGGSEGGRLLAGAKREYAGLGGHLKTSPQPGDGGGDWPGAAVCAGCAGWSSHTALGTGYPSSEPAPGSKARYPALPAQGQSWRI